MTERLSQTPQKNEVGFVEKDPGLNYKEKIKNAEFRIVTTFKEKLAEALERIGENPYFRDLEQTF